VTIEAPPTGAHPRLRSLGRRGLATVLMSFVVLAVFGAVAYAAMLPDNSASAHQLRLSGPVKIKDSHGNAAIVGMRRMQPGDSVSGSVNIGNASKKVRASFTVGLSRLVEVGGSGGGRLSDRLTLVVRRLSTSRRPETLYSGPLRRMPLVALGKMRPREIRTYQFTVAFPETSPVFDNRFQGAAVSLEFTWYARQAR
jgi:hypothetical protein